MRNLHTSHHYALLSVSDKTELLSLAQTLGQQKINILASGGTGKVLASHHIPYTSVEKYTASPPCLDGRVKTLHPAIFAGILAKRDDLSHQAELKTLEYTPIRVVVCNLYPFETYVQQYTEDRLIELIDIGGVALLRAAAKNYHDVVVLSDPQDYALLLEALTSKSIRRQLAIKALQMIQRYDACITHYLMQLESDAPTTTEVQTHSEVIPPTHLTLELTLDQSLRYGENPNQIAAFYQPTAPLQPESFSFSHALQWKQGKKALSYNNYLDLDTASQIPLSFTRPTVAIIKHCTPCGVGSGDTLVEAFQRAFDCDRQSAFGSVISMNQTLTLDFVHMIRSLFVEALLAPHITEEALCALQKYKPSCRVLTYQDSRSAQSQWQMKSACGGFLLQSIPQPTSVDLITEVSLGRSMDLGEVVSERMVTLAEVRALSWAWSVVSHVRSNAIVIADESSTLGIGTGQTSRVKAVQQAVTQVHTHPAYQSQDERSVSPFTSPIVMASDAFFPFADGIEAAVAGGISAVIQPGGSKRDDEVIAKVNELGLAMIFTQQRCFKH